MNLRLKLSNFPPYPWHDRCYWLGHRYSQPSWGMNQRTGAMSSWRTCVRCYLVEETVGLVIPEDVK